MWDWPRLAEIVRDGLAERERRLREEQAVYGLDSLRELDLHPILAESILASGLGVWRERAYPSMVGTPGARPGKSARDRCDLVLTPSPDITLADPIEAHREQDWLLGKGTREHTPSLFADLSTPPFPTPKPRLREIPPDEAAWVEIKVVAQFAFTHGVPGPNSAYSSELTGSLARDLSKLKSEPLVRHGAVMLVLFTQDERTAEHDVSIALHRCLDRDCRFRSPHAARFPMLDRAGNALCTIVIIPT
jgi:hypothetical protein